ncbi:helix-turn-helix domain-containing protein [Thiobaca trueperi]|uniref:Transcriptional regulator with XRE-family HTH domain n=1 Tax=Thiobaca trueperi TaxID=127458 RepID=A0A4R3MX98_9GAMM|nr:helix-turn-helix transcriptional regulator [Thiobaca trueperi]TCT21218.1 transcriptional regulator with XRE-family HTH domain [Thiobaca trueperi]
MIGPRLKSARLHAKLSQTALGELAGISQPFIALIERGEREPSDDVLERLAKALDLPVSALRVDPDDSAMEAEQSGPPSAWQKDQRIAVLSDYRTAPGLLALAQDQGLLALLKIRPDEWAMLRSLDSPFPVSKEGYVQLLLTLRAVTVGGEAIPRTDVQPRSSCVA